LKGGEKEILWKQHEDQKEKEERGTFKRKKNEEGTRTGKKRTRKIRALLIGERNGMECRMCRKK